MNELMELRGKPQRIRLDNGPELISQTLAQWAADNGVKLMFTQPGKPTQNAYIERFNRSYRTEVLNCYVFESLHEVRRLTEDWMYRYNHERPHEALGRIPPVAYRMQQYPNLLFYVRKYANMSQCCGTSNSYLAWVERFFAKHGIYSIHTQKTPGFTESLNPDYETQFFA